MFVLSLSWLITVLHTETSKCCSVFPQEAVEGHRRKKAEREAAADKAREKEKALGGRPAARSSSKGGKGKGSRSPH